MSTATLVRPAANTQKVSNPGTSQASSTLRTSSTFRGPKKVNEPVSSVSSTALAWPDTAELSKATRTSKRRPWRQRVVSSATQVPVPSSPAYLDENRKVVPVVPVRFVQACVKGHISDVDWYAFVRRSADTDRNGQLWLDEGGAGNDFSEIFVRCERTLERRPLAEAMVKGAHILGWCQGRQPWLGPRVWEPCKHPNRLLIRSASNAYFSQTVRVIAIPDQDAALKEAVDQVYEDFLQYAESAGDVKRERKKQKVFVALENISDEAAWAEVRRRKSGATQALKGIKQAEIETLLSSPDSIGEDRPGGDFYARTRPLPPSAPPAGRRGPALLIADRQVVAALRSQFETLVERNRALVGLTCRGLS